MTPAIPLPPSLPDVEFGIEIDFKPNTPDPARVYRSMTALIDACQIVDIDAAGAIGPNLRPILLLEDIRTGSLTTFLRTALESIDDDGIKGLEWKKFVGAYLVKTKHVLVNYLKDRETVRSKEEIYDLQAVIADAARQTGAIQLPEYKPLPARKVASSVKVLSEATQPLGPDDEVKYLSPEGVVEINKSFRVTAETIEELLTENTIVNPCEMILKVKRPDFLGSAQWDFRFDGKPLPAKMLDVEWLAAFRRGAVTIRPGDSLSVAAEETVKYGYDQEVIARHVKVLKVMSVIEQKRH